MEMFEHFNHEINTQENISHGLSYEIYSSMDSYFKERADKTQNGFRNSSIEKAPEEAYNLIRNFMEKSEALKGPDNYERQAVSSDLARACATIPVETPEMALNLINTTSELFEVRGNVGGSFQLETFAKQGRFLGDKKVAQAYLNATEKSFARLDTPYDACIPALDKYKSIVDDHPEMAAQVLGAVKNLQDKFSDNPLYNDCINDILSRISSNGKVIEDVRVNANEQLEKHSKTSHSNNIQKLSVKTDNKLLVSVREKAQNIVADKNTKKYSGGKNLFSKIKEKMEEFAKENPKLLTIGGAAAMFAGIGSMNPQLAAAGAIVMSAGVKAWSDKLKDIRGLGNNNISTPKQHSNRVMVNAIGGNRNLRGMTGR